ncbi:hypothetical protein FYC77_19720 [Natrialba swarupiae]|uniref:Uncharacterized protein n=1 Tax=Natrialba swarupiae TaxID=2448032 RepID=A0A5D5AER3_9EURY|nr:hypothetical protein [Natrialba sp. INN-245]TYT60288.1 hypothetical protein FYC77_19720 [Natrialba swarupiae]
MPALTVDWTHDPFFEHLFPDAHDQMDLSSRNEGDGAPAESDFTRRPSRPNKPFAGLMSDSPNR